MAPALLKNVAKACQNRKIRVSNATPSDDFFQPVCKAKKGISHVLAKMSCTWGILAISGSHGLGKTASKVKYLAAPAI